MLSLKEFGLGTGWVVESTVGNYGIGECSGKIQNKVFTDPDLLVFESEAEANAYIAAKDLAPSYHASCHSWGEVPEGFDRGDK